MAWTPTGGVDPPGVNWTAYPGEPSPLRIIWPEATRPPGLHAEIPNRGLSIPMEVGDDDLIEFVLPAAQTQAAEGDEFILVDSARDIHLMGWVRRSTGRGGGPSVVSVRTSKDAPIKVITGVPGPKGEPGDATEAILAAEEAASSALASAESAATAQQQVTDNAPLAAAAEAARDAAEGHAGDSATSAGQSATSAGAASTSAGDALGHANDAAGSASTAAGHASAAQTAETGAVAARTGAEAAKASLDATARQSLINAEAARAALAPLLSPYNPGAPDSGPVAVWLPSVYTPGTSGGPGRYPNLQDTGTELDALEPATAAQRPRRLPFTGEKYVWLPAVNGNSAARTATADGLDILGDLDLRVEVKPTTWRPAATATAAARSIGDIGATTPWRLNVLPGGLLNFQWTVSGGSAYMSAQSTVGVPDDGARRFIRATIDVDNGSGGWTVQFFTSPTGVVGSWTQLGSNATSTGGITNITPSSITRMEIGSGFSGSGHLSGDYYSAELRNGIDGPVVASWKARDMGQTGGMSGGRQWTINRSAGNNAKAVVVDRTVTLFDGVDDFLEVPHHPLISSDEVTVLHLHRRWGAASATTVLLQKKADFWGVVPGWACFISDSDVPHLMATGSNSVQYAILPTGVGRDELAVMVGRYGGGAHRLLIDGLRGVSGGYQGSIQNESPFRIGPGAHEWFGTFIFRRALSDSEIETITNRLLGRPDVQAERIDIDPLVAPLATSGTQTITAATSTAVSGRRTFTADGAMAEWGHLFSAGTWRLDLTCRTGPDAGIARVLIDGVSVGTTDLYAATEAHNVARSITFSIGRPGRRVVRVAVDGRNPSNTTGHVVGVQAIALQRTA